MESSCANGAYVPVQFFPLICDWAHWTKIIENNAPKDELDEIMTQGIVVST